MPEKRKISVRKIMQFVVTIIVAVGCIVAVAYASKSESGKYIRNIDVQIKNENKCHFIDKQQVMDLLVNDRHVDIKHIPAGKLDLHGMEEIVTANPWVGNSEIYVDNAHNLHINLTQRVPVARVFEEDGNSYYLDTALATMPLSDNYIYYTTVVTNVPVLKDDSLSKSLKGQIVHLVRNIERDTFWNAQVSQIIMTPDHTFELVPVLGQQRILVGDTSLLQEKLGNLFAFYKTVLNRIGWDKYDVIDVRYKGQVVATPALPWNAPADKAMSSMNWVKSIVGNDTGKTFTPAPEVHAPSASTPPPATVAAPEVKVAKAATPVLNAPVKPAAVVTKAPAKPAVVPVKEPMKPAVTPVKAPVKVVVPGAKTPAKTIAPAKTAVKPVVKKEVPEKAVKALPASAYPKPVEKVVTKPAERPAMGPPKPDDLNDKPAAKEPPHESPKAVMPAAKKEVKAVPKSLKKEVKKETAKKPDTKKPVKKEEVKKQTPKDKSKDSNKNH